jgi:hypothetical protein
MNHESNEPREPNEPHEPGEPPYLSSPIEYCRAAYSVW